MGRFIFIINFTARNINIVQYFMQKIRKIVTALVVVFIGLGFSSCDKDSADIVAKEKKLMKITYGDVVMTFNYDTQGRLTEIVDKYASGGWVRNCKYVWGENTVDFTLSIKTSETATEAVYEEPATLILKDGLAAEVVGTGMFMGEATFTYGASYRLSQFVGLVSNISFEWNDDRMTFVRDGTATTAGSVYDISYTYKSNIVTEGYNPLIPMELSDKDNGFFMAHPELAGVSSQRLPDSSVRRDWMGYFCYVWTYDYAYEFDEDGYVTKIIASYAVNGVEQTPIIYTMVWE